jgi:hypothetical protein
MSALSSTEAEYIALTANARHDLVWKRCWLKWDLYERAINHYEQRLYHHQYEHLTKQHHWNQAH